MAAKIVAGNWKLNGSKVFVQQFFGELKQLIDPVQMDACIAVFPPAVYAAQVADLVGESGIVTGLQNIAAHHEGAYTGEVSAAMAQDAGCRMALVGHSERRTLFGETDEIIAAKVAQGIESGLTVVACVGETLEQRQQDSAAEVVESQLAGALKDVTSGQLPSVVVAYEPVWAIGTGETASPEQAQEIHALIRRWLKNQFGQAGADISLLYGGSVKPDNAKELFAQADIDGGLIGGASLQPQSFAAICNAVCSDG